MKKAIAASATRTWSRVAVLAIFALLLISQPLYAQRGWSLEVLVNGQDNRPLANATVELVFNDASRVLTSATTNASGRATLTIPTHKPVELGTLNLFLYTEADRHAPELLSLSGSPDRMFILKLERAADNAWAQRTGRALRPLIENGSQIIDVLLPAAGSASLPVAPLVTGNPCDALPTGMNQCIRCPGLDMPTAVINGRVAFGRHKGKTEQQLKQLCGQAWL